MPRVHPRHTHIWYFSFYFFRLSGVILFFSVAVIPSTTIPLVDTRRTMCVTTAQGECKLYDKEWGRREGKRNRAGKPDFLFSSFPLLPSLLNAIVPSFSITGNRPFDSITYLVSHSGNVLGYHPYESGQPSCNSYGVSYSNKYSGLCCKLKKTSLKKKHIPVIS